MDASYSCDVAASYSPLLKRRAGGLGWAALLYAAEPVFRATIDACDRVARDLGAPVGQLSIAAANRYPARFDDPEGVDLECRVAHFAFGAGPQRCPGRRLARMQTEGALTALLERMPNFYGVQPACVLRWIPSAATHGLEQLMIAPGPSPGS